jgi:hypothetical protein
MVGFLSPPTGDYEPGINPEFQRNLLLQYINMKTEAACSFTMLVTLYQVTWHHIPESGNLCDHCHENLESHRVSFLSVCCNNYLHGARPFLGSYKIPQLVRQLPTFYATKSSVPCSLEPSTHP